MKNKHIYIAMGVIVVIMLLATGYIVTIIKKTSSNTQTSANQQQSTHSFGGQGGFNRASFASVIGTVSSVSGESVIVTTGSGKETVNVSSSTRIISLQASSQSMVAVQNNFVRVSVDSSDNADSITLLPTPTQSATGGSGFGGGGFGGRFGGGAVGGSDGGPNGNTTMYVGTVSQVNGNTITIESFNGSTINVTLTSSTEYATQAIGSISSITNNTAINALGTKESNGDVDARTITLGNLPAQ